MSRFLEEIFQQPEALRRMLAYYGEEGRRSLQEAADLCKGRRILFTGMGSSHYAPLSVRPALASAGVRAECWEAGELLHYHLETCDPESVVVAVSQSGESAETRQVVEEIREQCKVVSITNQADSSLGRCGDRVLLMQAGEEASISTKTYTNSLALLHLLASLLCGRDLDAETARLQAVADQMERFLDARRTEVDQVADFLQGASFLYFVARGPCLAAAHQGALTFNEGARLPTCALAGGSFRHGPLELAGPEFCGVFFAPRGRTWEISARMACEAAEAGGRVLLVAGKEPEVRFDRLRTLLFPDSGEDLFPLETCVPVELLLYEMARQRGREAGLFERITKVTQRE